MSMKEDVKARIEDGKIVIEYHNICTSQFATYHHAAKFVLSTDGRVEVIEPYHTSGQDTFSGNGDHVCPCQEVA